MFRGRAERALGVAQHGREFGGGDRAHVGANFALDRAVGGNALENDAGVVVGGIQRERDGAAGMHADAGDGNLVAQRCLLSTLHRTRYRRPASKPRVPSQAPAGATFWPSNRRPRTIRKSPLRTEKSLSRREFRLIPRRSPTHVFLPSVTHFFAAIARRTAARTANCHTRLSFTAVADRAWQASSRSQRRLYNHFNSMA